MNLKIRRSQLFIKNESNLLGFDIFFVLMF